MIYIDAEQLQDGLYNIKDGKIYKYKAKGGTVRTYKLENRPQGEWIWSPRDTDGTVSGCCSNCSFSHLFIGGHTAQYNYCPSCGARMKGADDE